MSTLEMIEAATPSIIRAPWCVEMNPECIGVLIEGGDTRKAAASIDTVAEHRCLTIVEICRVKHGDREAAFARGEARPYVAPAGDAA